MGRSQGFTNPGSRTTSWVEVRVPLLRVLEPLDGQKLGFHYFRLQNYQMVGSQGSATLGIRTTIWGGSQGSITTGIGTTSQVDARVPLLQFIEPLDGQKLGFHYSRLQNQQMGRSQGSTTLGCRTIRWVVTRVPLLQDIEPPDGQKQGFHYSMLQNYQMGSSSGFATPGSKTTSQVEDRVPLLRCNRTTTMVGKIQDFMIPGCIV